MSSLLPFAFGAGFLGGAIFQLWSLWKDWPQRRFRLYGQCITRERHPISYWFGLVIGTVVAVPVGIVGTWILVFALVH
jgi:hypothetical protein